MTQAVNLPPTEPVVTPLHRFMGTPIRLMSALNIGPFGGENSISSVIEALVLYKRGTPLNYELTLRTISEKCAKVLI